ncbi:MAG: hypothetical protein CIT01_07355 [Methanobacterium sp. BRmetb2]|nr:MAG: hypothetical protein CIT01_07355 [Methanobacterium sp. BRmetb2]
MNKKLIPIILIIISIITMIMASSSVGKINEFNNGELNFNYPEKMEIIGKGTVNTVATFYDPELELNISINKQALPSNYTFRDHLIRLERNYTENFSLISNNTVEISGKEGYEVIYKIKEGSLHSKLTEFWVVDNGFLYSISVNYPLNSTENSSNIKFLDIGEYLKDQKRNKYVETITNSFNIQNPERLDNNSQNRLNWAQVRIPSQNYKWSIRSDTVNALGAVYHYPESVYPGNNGTCGLLGHRSLFSAPFSKINMLVPGDLVIIDDFLTLNSYTYQVVSNGHIKWDYEYNPIKFTQTGSSRLFLVTCYPPGRTDAAWIVECKLISVKPLISELILE